MKRIKFETVIDGVKRVAAPKQVKGYKLTIRTFGVFRYYYWQRGHIQYMFDSNTNCFVKFSLKECKYLDITYDDFRKFIDIERI